MIADVQTSEQTRARTAPDRVSNDRVHCRQNKRECVAHLRDNLLRSGKHTIKKRTADREAPGSCFRKPSYLRLGHNQTSPNTRPSEERTTTAVNSSRSNET